MKSNDQSGIPISYLLFVVVRECSISTMIAGISCI
jgi:hypothetical protein